MNEELPNQSKSAGTLTDVVRARGLVISSRFASNGSTTLACPVLMRRGQVDCLAKNLNQKAEKMRYLLPTLVLTGLVGCGSNVIAADPPAQTEDKFAEARYDEYMKDIEAELFGDETFSGEDQKKLKAALATRASEFRAVINEIVTSLPPGYLSITADTHPVHMKAVVNKVEKALEPTKILIFQDAGVSHPNQVEALKKLGFRPMSDRRTPNGYSLNLFERKINDSWLVYLRGMTDMTDLTIRNINITDAGLENIKGLTNLKTILLYGIQVTDAGLVHLKGLNQLESLEFKSTIITDAGLEHLKGLTSLKSLRLSGTEVTDEGVAVLQQSLPKCRISVRDSRPKTPPKHAVAEKGSRGNVDASQNVDVQAQLDALARSGAKFARQPDRKVYAVIWDSTSDHPNLEHLKGLTDVTDLSVSYTKVTDADLAHLKGLNHLLKIWMSFTSVSDAGLESLTGMNNLTVLNLKSTKVTDAGLEHLKGLKHLKSLDLGFTKVTDAGVAKLQQSLPELRISR